MQWHFGSGKISYEFLGLFPHNNKSEYRKEALELAASISWPSISKRPVRGLRTMGDRTPCSLSSPRNCGGSRGCLLHQKPALTVSDCPPWSIKTYSMVRKVHRLFGLLLTCHRSSWWAFTSAAFRPCGLSQACHKGICKENPWSTTVCTYCCLRWAPLPLSSTRVRPSAFRVAPLTPCHCIIQSFWGKRS